MSEKVKQPAIVCDLDGTLCKRCDRSPYDETKVFGDTVNEPVKAIIDKFKDTHAIIFVSGRSKDCLDDTVKWIRTYTSIPSHPIERMPQLYMRESGDVRKDSIVKKEIYDTLIKNDYDVLFVLDDRDQVVQMWRENGLS